MRKIACSSVLILGLGLPFLSDAARLDQADILHVKARRKDEVSSQMVDFRLNLIEKALTASGQRYVIDDCDVPKYPTSDARYAVLVSDGARCDVLATASGAGFTKELLLVPVPMYLGGGGYRVFLGNRANAARVAVVKDLEGLRRLRIGSGTFWSDSDIMTDSGLNVIRASYSSLFSMLEADRFDLLSRSIYEIGGEKQLISKHPALVVEPRLLLHYPSDLFFYVSKARPELQKALTLGMTRMYCSGELQRYILEHPSTKDVMDSLQVRQRIILELENKHLTKAEAQALADFAPLSRGKDGSLRVTDVVAKPVLQTKKFQSICKAVH